MTRANEWRRRAAEQAREEAVELTLPSGAKVLARRPDPMQLAVWGKLPLHLVGTAAGEMPGEVGSDEAVAIATMMRDLLCYCLVDPRVSEQPGEDEIHPREIPQKDWQFLMNWSMRAEEAEKLRPFRVGRTDAGAGIDSAEVRPAAVHIAGDRGSSVGTGDRPGGGGSAEPSGRGGEAA